MKSFRAPNKKSYVLIIIVFLIIAIGVGIFFFIQNDADADTCVLANCTTNPDNSTATCVQKPGAGYEDVKTCGFTCNTGYTLDAAGALCYDTAAQKVIDDAEMVRLAAVDAQAVVDTQKLVDAQAVVDAQKLVADELAAPKLVADELAAQKAADELAAYKLTQIKAAQDWSCIASGSSYIPARVTDLKTKQVECLSYNGSDCLWGSTNQECQNSLYDIVPLDITPNASLAGVGWTGDVYNNAIKEASRDWICAQVNNEYLPSRVSDFDTKEAQCLSYDASNCLWGKTTLVDCQTEIDNIRPGDVKPLTNTGGGWSVNVLYNAIFNPSFYVYYGIDSSGNVISENEGGGSQIGLDITQSLKKCLSLKDCSHFFSHLDSAAVSTFHPKHIRPEGWNLNLNKNYEYSSKLYVKHTNTFLIKKLKEQNQHPNEIIKAPIPDFFVFHDVDLAGNDLAGGYNVDDQTNPQTILDSMDKCFSTDGCSHFMLWNNHFYPKRSTDYTLNIQESSGPDHVGYPLSAKTFVRGNDKFILNTLFTRGYYPKEYIYL